MSPDTAAANPNCGLGQSNILWPNRPGTWVKSFRGWQRFLGALALLSDTGKIQDSPVCTEKCLAREWQPQAGHDQGTTVTQTAQ